MEDIKSEGRCSEELRSLYVQSSQKDFLSLSGKSYLPQNNTV